MVGGMKIQHIENKMKHICSTMKSMKWRKYIIGKCTKTEAKHNFSQLLVDLEGGQTTPCLFITQGCLEERGGGGEKGGDC